MINKLNLYQLLFAALFILKIGDVGKFADFSWWWVFAPFVLGALHTFLSWVAKAMELPEKLRDEIGITYLDVVRRRATRKALKSLQKEQEEAWRKRAK